MSANSFISRANSFISRATSVYVQANGNQKDKDDLWSLAFKIWGDKDNSNSGGRPITVNSLADFMYSTVVDSRDFTRAYGKNKKAAVDDAKKAAKKYLGKN